MRFLPSTWIHGICCILIGLVCNSFRLPLQCYLKTLAQLDSSRISPTDRPHCIRTSAYILRLRARADNAPQRAGALIRTISHSINLRMALFLTIYHPTSIGHAAMYPLLHHPQTAPERLQASTLGIPADVSRFRDYAAFDYLIKQVLTAGECLTIGDVGILDPATGSIAIFFNITIPRDHWSNKYRPLPPYETFPLDFTRDVEHTSISNEGPFLVGKGDISVLENKSYPCANAQLPAFLTSYLSLQPSQLELDRCLSGEESVTLKYSFEKRHTLGGGERTIVIPVGPIVKSTLRPHVHEQWRSYVAAHWAGWHKHFARSCPIGFFGRHKLVVVQGHVKAASRVNVTLKGTGKLSVTINVPSLKSQYEQRILKKFRGRQKTLAGLLQSEDWTLENKLFGSQFLRLRPWQRSDELNLVDHLFGHGLCALPAMSPAAISFDLGKTGCDLLHGLRYGKNCLAVRAPRSSSKDGEPAICFDVAETLFYHTTSIGPKVPLLGFPGSRIREFPPLSSRSGWMVRTRKKLRGILEARDEQEKEEDIEEAGWLLWDYDMKVAHD